MEKKFLRCPACSTGVVLKTSNDDKPVKCPKCNYQSIVSQFEVIEPKKIVCPSCRVILMVDPLLKGIITCPHCKKNENIDHFKAPPVKKTGKEIPSRENDPNKTVLPGQLQQGNQYFKPGKLMLIEGECIPDTIQFRKGVNTIGRKAASSDSSIQLETRDGYISRKHAMVELIMKPDYTFEHRLSDAGSQNGTYHNNERMEQGEIVILQKGDTLRLGHTLFRFETE